MKRFIAALFSLLLASQAYAGCTLGALPFTLTNNTLADATQVMANFNQIVNAGAINCAQSGSNNDITSLNALSTPITPAQGGANIFTASSPTGGLGNAQTMTVPAPYALVVGVTVQGVVGTGLGNNGATTLAVNGGTAFPVLRNTSVGSAVLVGGELTPGNLLTATFTGSAWTVQGRYDIVGEMRMFGGSTVPLGWVAADGSTLPCTGNSATLCGVIGTLYGANGTLPDSRGRNMAGMDSYGTPIGSAGRLTSVSTGCGANFTFPGATCPNSSQSHTQIPNELATHSHTVNDPGHGHQISTWDTASVTTLHVAAGGNTVNENGTLSGQVLNNTTGISLQNSGLSQPMPIVNPNLATFIMMKL